MTRRRKGLSKKLRFEVLKRDGFTCQYCGGRAPDVLLQVDHIQPVARGGGNELLNLVTSCHPCNSGKGARELGDGAVVAKQMDQLAELQERREQLDLLFEWKQGLTNLAAVASDKVCDHVEHRWGLYLSDHGRDGIRKLTSKWGMERVMDAVDIAADTYLARDESGKTTRESFALAFGKVGGICFNRKQIEDKPYLDALMKIRATLNRRVYSCDKRDALELLEEAHHAGVSHTTLRRLAWDGGSFYAWRNAMLDIIAEHGG